MYIKDNNWVIEKIREASDHGLQVVVNGVSYQQFPKEELMIFLEKTPYMMMDYEGDECGRIVTVNFNPVRSR